MPSLLASVGWPVRAHLQSVAATRVRKIRHAVGCKKRWAGDGTQATVFIPLRRWLHKEKAVCGKAFVARHACTKGKHARHLRTEYSGDRRHTIERPPAEPAFVLHLRPSNQKRSRLAFESYEEGRFFFG